MPNQISHKYIFVQYVSLLPMLLRLDKKEPIGRDFDEVRRLSCRMSATSIPFGRSTDHQLYLGFFDALSRAIEALN